jgi:hypothetical protein
MYYKIPKHETHHQKSDDEMNGFTGLKKTGEHRDF